MPVKDREKELNPAEKKYGSSSHDDLGVHPERREAEVDDLEKLHAAESAPEVTYDSEADESEKEKLDESVGWKNKVKGSSGSIKSANKLRKRAGVAGGLAGFIAAMLIGVLSILSPFKITHVVNSIEQRVGEIPQNAVENRLEWYVTRYLMVQAVGGSDIDIKNRGFTYIDSSWFKTLRTNWKGAKLEVKLLENYGVKLEPVQGDSGIGRRLSSPNQWKLVNVGVSKSSPLAGQTLDKTEVRQFIREFARSETKSHQVIKRHNMRKLLKRYNGIDKWKPFEKKIDAVEDSYNSKKLALKKQIIQRTVGNLSPRYGAYFSCLLDTNKDECRKGLKGETPDVDSPDVPRNELDDAVEEALDGNSTDGNNAITRRVLDKLSNVTIKQGLKKLIPVVGWLNMASVIVDKVDDGSINQIIYARNAQQYASFASTFISANDQIRAGEDFDTEDVRVANDLLDGFEKSPVYQTGTQTGASTLFAGSKAYAAGQIRRDCNGDGDKDDPEDLLDVGETVCPNKRLIQDKTTFFTDSAAWDSLVSASKVEQSTIGAVFGFVDDAIGAALDALKINDAISAISDALGLSELASKAFQVVMDRVFAPPLSGNEENEDAYDGIYGGMLVMNSQYGGGVGEARQDTIAGKALSSAEISAINQETQEMYAYRESQQSTLERYLSPLNNKSLTSFAVVHSPSVSEASDSLLANINPAKFIGIFSSLFTNKAGAQTSFSFNNPHKSVQYGYPVNHPIFSANGGEGMDPDQVEVNYKCSLPPEDRPQNKVFGRTDEIPFEVPLEEDPCQLEERVAEVGSMYFTGGYDEGIDASSPPQTPVGVLPTPGKKATKEVDTSSLPCAGSPTSERKVTIAGGAQRKLCDYGEVKDVDASWSPNVSAMLQAASGQISLAGSGFRDAQKQIDLRRAHCGTSDYAIYEMSSSSCSPPTARPGSSNHELGLAIDFKNCSTRSTACYQWLAANASQFGVINLPSEPWHWSIDGR